MIGFAAIAAIGGMDATALTTVLFYLIQQQKN
jgi:hypothetical protein